jgi:hypothetical protein
LAFFDPLLPFFKLEIQHDMPFQTAFVPSNPSFLLPRTRPRLPPLTPPPLPLPPPPASNSFLLLLVLLVLFLRLFAVVLPPPLADPASPTSIRYTPRLATMLASWEPTSLLCWKPWPAEVACRASKIRPSG